MAIQTFEEQEVYAGFKYQSNLSTSLLAYALTISPNHISFGSLSGSSYTGNDLPSDDYKTSTFYINCRSANSIVVYLTPDDSAITPQLNKYTDSWSGWQAIGGDSKFVKGQAIPFYDTDGETVLNNILPENLVYYDSAGGEEIASNFIFCNPNADITLAATGTVYYPTLTTVKKKGSGFEIASNGDVKCNKNGVVKITACFAFGGTSSTQTNVGWISKNRTVLTNSYGAQNNTYTKSFTLQNVVEVVEGDTITMGAQTAQASAGTWRADSTLLCEYIEDYYITREMPDIDKVYPVGSIYMSVNNTDPSLLFGGTWQQIKDTFLLSAGDTYTAGNTGGEATHTLIIEEMPSHQHQQNASNAAGGSTSSGNGTIDPYNQGSAWGSAKVSAVGGGQPHNNMPPYLVVYMWQRTA